jgi:hypothetical protein
VAVAWKGRPGPPAANVMGTGAFPLGNPSNVMVPGPGSLVRSAGALMVAVKVTVWPMTLGFALLVRVSEGVPTFVSSTSESARLPLVKSRSG